MTRPTGPIRFRSRHLHATFYNHLKGELDAHGWRSAPVNFGAEGVTVIDFQPDERNSRIEVNTVAVTLGDYDTDEDEELGAAIGGMRSALYNIFIDTYMQEQSLSLAICDDIRDIYQDLTLPLIDQITLAPVAGTLIEVDRVVGPDKPAANVGAEQFKKFWRTMRVDGRLFFNT